jgi:hypothetical protein
MKPQLSLERINQLAAEPGQCANMATPGRVDPSRPFVPEEHTQLYYTPVYATLSDVQRLRYNQLFGLRLNEYIMTLEAELIERLLAPLRRHPSVRSDGVMLLALDTMMAEERLHYAGFAAFNRAFRPDLYRVSHDRFFARLPWWTQAMFSVVGWLAWRYAFALWYMMAMEESAKSLARDMALQPHTATLGPLDPAFVALHHQHMKDETRHVHIDALLIERCMDNKCATLNARLFTAMLGGVVRPTRGGSGAKVIRQLVRDMPELAPREAELIAAVLSLKDDRRFQESLFNRRIMPRTFELFDATPALADLGKKMVGYDRRAPPRAA